MFNLQYFTFNPLIKNYGIVPRYFILQYFSFNQLWNSSKILYFTYALSSTHILTLHTHIVYCLGRTHNSPVSSSIQAVGSAITNVALGIETEGWTSSSSEPHPAKQGRC